MNHALADLIHLQELAWQFEYGGPAPDLHKQT